MSAKGSKKPFFLYAIVGFAAAVVAFAGFRTVETISLASSETTLTSIGFGNQVADEGLEEIASARAGKNFVTEPARIKSDYALVKIMLAEKTADDSKKRALLGEAVTALESSLVQNPANPYVWFRLAHARNLLGANGEDVVAPLRLSFMTGPHEPRLVFTRLPLALAHIDQMDETTQTLLHHQIRFAWKEANRRTAYLAVSFGREDYFHEIISASDPDGAKRFRAYISFIEDLRTPDS